MKKTLLLLTTILLLIGCGSDDEDKKTIDSNRTKESNLTTPPPKDKNSTTPNLNNYNEKLKYNYNSDKSAIQELLPLYVNRYEKVQANLDTLIDDREKFENQYEWYVGDLISTQRAIDKHPSYAPRGDNKSLIVTVKDGQIDYSAYELKGDIDENGEVDFEDEKLLKEALLSGDDKYDINGDDVVDIKDAIDLLARLGTEIKTFDFYTTDGTKLDIASRDFSDSRSFSYSGAESRVMVVAKDANGVSGFTSGLSDMDKLWYVGLSTQKQQKIIQKEEGLEATNPKRIKFVKEALAYIQQKPNPYLLGWKISVKFTTTDSTYLQLDSHGLEDMDSSYFTHLKDKINPHFKNTKMGKPTKEYLTKNLYLYFIGAGRYVKDKEIEGKYEFDLTADSFETHVKAFRKTLKNFKIINNKKVATKNIAYASSLIFTSKPNKTLSGWIKEDGTLIKDKGKIKAHRIGPNPKEEHYENGLERSKYKLENIPFGAYKLEYERACGCTDIIDSEFIFSTNRAYTNQDFNIDKKEVKVKLTVRDKDKNLLKGQNVKIESGECLEEKKIFLDVSDTNGKVSFNDVPIGQYKVYVDDEESGTIDFCNEFDGEAMGKKLWDIDFKYVSKSTGGQSSDFEGTGEWHWKKIKIASITDPVTSIETAMQLEDKQDVFPLRIDNGSYGSFLMLTETTFFDNAKYGLALNYTESSPQYCVTIDEGLLDNHIKALHPSLNHDELSFAPYFFPTSCGEDIAFGSRTIDTSLSNSNINAMKEHREFTVQSTGSWTNGQGETTMTVNFRPSK